MKFNCLLSHLLAAHQIASCAKATNEYPHIIFILADDVGYNDFGWSGDDFVGLTNTLDALKDDGIEISNYYTQQICTPARASLMTGRYPFTIGMQADAISPLSIWGLPTEYSILPQYLAKYKYESHGIGKWHLGHAFEHYLPHHRGFLSFYGFLLGEEHYRSHKLRALEGYLDFVELWSSSNTSYVDYTGHQAKEGFQCLKNKEGIQSSKLYTDRIISIAQQWNKNGGREAGVPLFLYAAYQNSHLPIEPDPSRDYSSVQDILNKIHDEDRYGNAKLMYELDQEVQRLLVGLEDNGVLDNYILVFATDNGPCKPSGGSPYPLRGGKFCTFEGGSRTRAFITSSMFDDSVVKSEYSNLFHVSDWLPTLMDAVSPGWSLSGTASDLDGVSHWRALVTGNSIVNARTEVVYNLQKSAYNGDDYYLFGAIRVGNWKLVLNEHCQLWIDYYGRFNADTYLSQCKSKSMSCIVERERETYLFNLVDDPSEVYDLKNENSELFTSLLLRYMEYETKVKEPVSIAGNGSMTNFEDAYESAGCVSPFMGGSPSFTTPRLSTKSGPNHVPSNHH